MKKIKITFYAQEFEEKLKRAVKAIQEVQEYDIESVIVTKLK